MMHMIVIVIISCLICSISSMNVTILHTNDIHSRFVSFDSKMKPCDNTNGQQSNKCWGGAARRLTAIKQMRSKYENVLLLDGGDQFQGTLWYTILKWKPISEIVSAMKYDAMSFGNHEFDDGLIHNDKKLGDIGLVPYLQKVNATFVATNLESTSDSPMKSLYKKYHIVEVGGQRFGIVGYITPETKSISHPGDTLTFKDEIESLKSAVQELKDMGINKIMAIGHSGIDIDKKICEEVKGVDVVVGGHTNTFLYTGTPPSKPEPDGVYPIAFATDENGYCLVVQDYAFGKYLGFLQVEFDDSGVIKSWNGNPILIDNKFEEDEQIKTILGQYEPMINDFQKSVIGRTAVTLNGSRWQCRLRECNFGNVFTDAMIYSYLQKRWDNPKKFGFGWATSAIAIVNSACWRDFEAESMQNLTMADMFNTLVYANTVELIQIHGKHLWSALEHSVFDIEKSKDDPHGKFLQVSGLKVKYNMQQPSGSRVQSVMVKCANCTIPIYKPLEMEKAYSVVTISFLKKGGDGFDMIKNNLLYSDGLETLDIDVMQEYVKKHSPLTTGLEGRIEMDGPDCLVSAAPQTVVLSIIIIISFSFLTMLSLI